MNAMQGQTCPLVPNPMEQGLQSEDIEKRRQGATLLDRPLNSERLQAIPVHLHHRLLVVVYHANPFAELWFESGDLQNSRQEPMINTVVGLGLI